jgi:Rieske Fe-S protein
MIQHDTTPTDARAPGIQRRVVLLGAGAVGVAGVLAACGGSDSPGAGADTASPEASPSTPTGTPAQPPSAAPTETGSGGTPLAATADVPVGGGLVVSAEQVVVTQPTAGEFKGFTSICTHQGCEVSRVEDGVISCPCHGSQYSAADGSVSRGPAPAPLAEVAVTVEGDQILLG